MSTIRIAGATLNQTPLDWTNNTKNIKAAIAQAKEKKVQLLCLPELSIIGYGNEDMLYSQWLPEKALQQLLLLKEECEGITVVFGLPVRKNGLLFNCVAVVKDKEILGFTAKQFLAYNEVYYEPRWFVPWKGGEKDAILIEGKPFPFGDVFYDIDGVKIAFEICEDAWRGDVRPARSHLLHKMDLILNPSASHFAFGKSKKREDLVIESSKNFNCTYLYCSLLGNEAGRIIFDGEIIIAQKGNLLKRNSILSFKDVNLLFTDVDLESASNPVAETSKYDYNKNEEFPQALSLALFDYLRKSRSKGFVLSLSGGADSSTCAVMIAEMVKRGCKELGINEFLRKAGLPEIHNELKDKDIPEKEAFKFITSRILTCAYQGTINSSKSTYESAKQLALEIGAAFHSWQIDEEVDSYSQKIEKVLGRRLDWNTDDIALQNIQARARAPIIWMLTNIKNALLIATSNRSEGNVGYATMDGDMAGSISPIAGVDKHFLIHWLQWAEKTLGYKSLKFVNSLQPSAELRPVDKNQTDEADLMPYSIIVEIEKLAIRDKLSPKEVFEMLKIKKLEPNELLKQHIIKFYRLWSRNQWKRERIAPSFHLDDLNIDPRSWMRFPILSGGFEEELKELKDTE